MVNTSALLPNGRQQFLDGQGNPLASGSVFFYIPTTTTFKDTWQDPARAVLNTNPVLLDSSGEAVIFGDGDYRQVVLDVFGNTIWDEVTSQYITVGGDLSGQLPNPQVNSGFVEEEIQDAPIKGSIVDADRIAGLDSASANALTSWTWVTIKTALQTFLTPIFSALFAPISAPGAGFSKLKVQTISSTSVTVTADIATLFTAAGAAFGLRGINASASLAASGAGGLDTGAEAASTWYNVFVIYNPATLTTAVLLSLSSTSPVMPVGFTYKIRVGAIRNDGSSNLWRTLQVERKAQIVIGTNPTTLPIIASGNVGSTTVPTWVAQATGNFVPPTASEITLVIGATDNVIVAPNGSYGNLASIVNPPPFAFDYDSAAKTNPFGTIILETSDIYYAGNSANSVVFCLGWVDNL